MLFRLFFLLFAGALSGCASYTADYQERLISSLPNQRDVTIHDSRTYPGNVLCGSYSSLTENGFSMRTSKFVVGEEIVLRGPSKEEVSVYCSKDSQQAFYNLSGIGPVEEDWTALIKVRDDMLAIDGAITRYYNTANTLPYSLETLLEGEFGVSKDNLVDPWGRAYVYAGGLSGRTAPRFTLRSYGADGAEGGKDADADISRDQVQMLAHVLRVAGY
ncbi:type II secretion system protein GspG [Congregibacter sp.]|uniref:type II secretion system protein GspG n=1 Tax=Congregibacter sp. TaxID=2744308 RepID=UPI003F6CAEFA